MAEEHPLVCLVDDAQWLDRASAQVLAFAARRLHAESVGVVFAARGPGEEFAGLPELVIGCLPDTDARAVLDTSQGTDWPLDCPPADASGVSWARRSIGHERRTGARVCSDGRKRR